MSQPEKRFPLEVAAVPSDPPALYLNRELSWLEFNARVLAEAEDPSNPLLERLKFVGIFDNNLDEFFMKRVGGLKQQLASNVRELSPDGRTPRQQLAEINRAVRPLLARQRRLLQRGAVAGLARARPGDRRLGRPARVRAPPAHRASSSATCSRPDSRWPSTRRTRSPSSPT